MKDNLNIATFPEDLKKCREGALKYKEFGSLKGRYPVRIDSRTIIYKKKAL
jgi:hypothetical protein